MAFLLSALSPSAMVAPNLTCAYCLARTHAALRSLTVSALACSHTNTLAYRQRNHWLHKPAASPRLTDPHSLTRYKN